MLGWAQDFLRYNKILCRERVLDKGGKSPGGIPLLSRGKHNAHGIRLEYKYFINIIVQFTFNIIIIIIFCRA